MSLKKKNVLKRGYVDDIDKELYLLMFLLASGTSLNRWRPSIILQGFTNCNHKNIV